ncbi:ATP-dependent DNA ligase [Sandaracinus amylolyticus]|uniref:DNA ligase (ATP) n=1 Tax=Sandaracinus amylolyticus TaxID=927083 RepID=A0A0F6SDM4_9BACT|nr:ATP-dependent DNA ligase [Sandaracinus amylolyticus]AKF03699.1 ATP-dependent DNA ligase [Sandaracinus amylolyticus]
MHAFARLYERLDGTTSTQAKVDAMRDYFRDAPPEDAAWALFFLTGRRFKRLVPVRAMAGWAMEVTGVPGWLFEECYGAVGDLAEIIALLVAGMPYDVPPEPRAVITPKDARAARSLFDDEPAPEVPAAIRPTALASWAHAILALRDLPEPVQRARVLALWRDLDRTELMLVTKMITGEMRVGASALLVQRAVSVASGVPAPVIAHRMMGTWEPDAAIFARLIAPASIEEDPSRPYPFALASPLEQSPETLGPRDEWRAEWKWDGIRCQLVRRAGELWLWSRGEDLVTERFPEIVHAAQGLPDGLVLDGEAMAWRDDRPLPFAIMQRRIGRKVLGPKVLAEAPVVFLAYDLLEEDREDLRERPFDERRARLEHVIRERGDPRLRLSPLIDAPSWEALAELRARSREEGTEGLMLKHRDAPYRPGRRRGEFWKWKIEPYSVDAVLVYAQPGSGKRSNLFTDYTFAVFDENRELVPFAKAYSGLEDEEITELDRWIRRNTLDRHGPVRVVEPVHVFELAFEGIAPSTRHRSGVAVRFPRIARWRRDKPVAEADTIESLRALLRAPKDPPEGDV